MYVMFFKKRASKAMLGQVAKVRNQMEGELEALQSNPNDPALDIEPISGSDLLRLKFRGSARGFRAVFSRDDREETLVIKAVEPRGQAYSPRRLQR